MRWLKRDRWKAGIALAGMLLLLVFMVWLPVSAADTYEGAPGLATPVTVQTTPTEDATITALNKEKLEQEIDQLKNQNYWAWTTIGPILVGFAGLLAALYSFITWIRNRQDEQKKRGEEQKRWLEDRQAERERRDEEQQRWLKDQEAEREKRAEERFQAVVEGLGSEREEAKVGAAITLRTFLRPGYEQFYTQVFDLAVAYLCLPRTPNSPEDPNAPLPLTTLRRALIVVFKEAFPLARDRLLKEQGTQFHSQSLDASGIRLDIAYLRRADLEQVRMPHASLRGAYLRGANLSRADLYRADLSRVRELEEVRSLDHTDLRRVIGLTKEQLEACKAKGALIDEDTATSSSHTAIPSAPPQQSNGVQVLSTPPAQENTPTPETG